MKSAACSLTESRATPGGRARSEPERVPGQERGDGSDDTQQVEDGVLQQRLHGPVRVRGRVAGGTRSVVAQSDGEEQGDAEGYGGPVHPGLRESGEKATSGKYQHECHSLSVSFAFQLERVGQNSSSFCVSLVCSRPNDHSHQSKLLIRFPAFFYRHKHLITGRRAFNGQDIWE